MIDPIIGSGSKGGRSGASVVDDEQRPSAREFGLVDERDRERERVKGFGRNIIYLILILKEHTKVAYFMYFSIIV